MEYNIDKILELVKVGDTPLSQNPVFSFNPESLILQEFQRCKSLYLSRSSLNNTLSLPDYQRAIIELMGYIFHKEMPHQKKLISIASDIIKDIYQLPRNVIINPHLKQDITISKHPNKLITVSNEEKEKLHPHIQKRLLLNSIVFGSSIHIWKTVYHIAKEEIENIYTGVVSLFDLYEKYTSLISIYVWNSVDPEVTDTNNIIVQGKEEIRFNNDKIELVSQAINFPVLLHEINKGVIDALILKGIDQNLSKKELEYVFQEADNYGNELWHQYLSPTLYVKLLEDWKVETKEIPKKITELCKMDYEELKNYMIKIQK